MQAEKLDNTKVKIFNFMYYNYVFHIQTALL
jgi:hypothetical protein